MKKSIMDVMKISVLLLLAPQSQSSMCSKQCIPAAHVDIVDITSHQPSGLEAEFPLVQTIILDL
jgi:hypothetical protein